MPVLVFHRKNSPVGVALLRRCMTELLHYCGKEEALLEISLVGVRGMAKLNEKYLKKPGATDVLSFPQDWNPSGRGAPWHLGEIVIATEIARRQALRAHRSLNQQVLRLAVHGWVHLQGLDHERGEKEKKRFESFEKKYLKHLDGKGYLTWDGSLRF